PLSLSLSTLSLHDALPIFDLQLIIAGIQVRDVPGSFGSRDAVEHIAGVLVGYRDFGPGYDRACRVGDSPDHGRGSRGGLREQARDRKSTRLNSSHQIISYA